MVLRGLVARRLRSALTVLAVLLGVTMISGTFVLTDTIRRAFDELFTSQTRGADAIVSGRVGRESQFSTPPPLSTAVLARVRRLPEVAAAAGQINDVAAVIGRDGEVVKTGAAPTIAATHLPPPFGAMSFTRGRAPRGAGEVAIDADTVEEQGFRLGETVRVAAGGPVRRFELVGIARFGTQYSLGGASVVVFDLPTAQLLFDKPREVDFAFVAARDGVSQEQLIAAVRRVLPPEAQVRTAEEQAQADADEIGEALGFLTTGLLAFGFIAVLVGAFLIFNTFSITVAQRTRELALLRTLGAARRQLLASVLLEALVLGAAGAVIGLVAGLGFARAINALFQALEIDLPSTDAVVRARTVVVCLVTGVVVTVAGALAPALRATRVAPVEALRDAAAPPRRPRTRRAVAGAAVALAVAGAALVTGGLLLPGGDETLKLIGAAGGAVLLVLGIALVSPRLVPRAARLIGAPLERATALVGRLARENATRNPGRTAVTSAALMIGLALVVFVTVFADGLRARTERVLDRTFAGDLAILHQDNFSTIPAAVGPAVARVPGVAAVSTFTMADAEIAGRDASEVAVAIDRASIQDVYRFDWVDGSDELVPRLGARDVLVEEDTAGELGLAAGDELRLRGTGGREAALTVRGVYRDDGLLEGMALSRAAFDRLFEQSRIFAALVALDDGAPAEATRRRVAGALRAFPEARARDQQQLEEEIAQQVTQVLGLFYALLAMSVLISAFGIVNTLSLSIHERTREIGLLRAVGMTRADVRRMIRYESVITAAFGAVLGLALGLFFAWVVTRALAGEGIVFSVPVIQLALLLVFALLVGVVAAILPARRAARLDVLRAIAWE